MGGGVFAQHRATGSRGRRRRPSPAHAPGGRQARPDQCGRTPARRMDTANSACSSEAKRDFLVNFSA